MLGRGSQSIKQKNGGMDINYRFVFVSVLVSYQMQRGLSTSLDVIRWRQWMFNYKCGRVGAGRFFTSFDLVKNTR